jgi:anaerobic ribonucleoside-triphosphate reductase activating protein
MMVNQTSNPGYRTGNRLNLAGFLPRSAVNGPGTRAVLWVQGCPHRCRGCFNEQFQRFIPVTPAAVDELAETITAIPGIDGVTFSGGEPFSQAGPLAELGEKLRSCGFSVVTYSGYTVEQLAKGNDPAWPALLAATDLLIAGPYVAKCARPDFLKGSANQQVIALGTRIRLPRDAGPAIPAGARAEFTIHPDGTITASGFPAPDLLFRLASRLGGA